MDILAIQLASPDLALLHDFYARVLNLPVLGSTTDKIEFQVGGSMLSFLRSPQPLAGAYHFAINIPENQFGEAVVWLKVRAALIADETGADMFYSDDWDSHSAYFYDPAGNILELIARHTLPYASQEPFGEKSLLGVSEIGVGAESVPAQVQQIAARGEPAVYRGAGSETFCALGDEHGLFIVVKYGRIWFPQTGKPARPLPLTVVTRGDGGSLTWQFP